MYVWITARRIRPGMMTEFLKVWQDPGINMPLTPPSPGGPTLFSLHPPESPDEMWGMGFFDSLEAIETYRSSPDHQRRTEKLEPYIEETLWNRVFEARPWNERDRPLVYAVYIRPSPHRKFQLTAICPTARDAVAQAEDLLTRARSSGAEGAEWTMRAYPCADDALDTLPATEGHTHVGMGAVAG